MAMPKDWMTAIPNRRAIEVIIWDADALLGDACGVVAGGGRSEILAAIDAGILVALMSEQAYREVGWMYPKAARGHSVDEDVLRDVIEAEYLPRARVVTLPAALDEAWAPVIDDVSDPADVQHAQLARFVAPSCVYSHDKHLRIPGYAPSDRSAYREIVDAIGTLTHYREVLVGTAMSMNGTSLGVAAIARAAARRLRTRPSFVVIGASFLTATAVVLVLQHPERRRLAKDAATKLVESLEAAANRDDQAGLKLAAASLVRSDPLPHPEARVAAFLARNPEATIAELREGLGSGAPTLSELRRILELHPAFVSTGPHHWALGIVRTTLID